MSSSLICHSNDTLSIVSSGETTSFETQCSYLAWESFSLSDSERSHQSVSRLHIASNSSNTASKDMRLRSRFSLNSTDSWSSNESLFQSRGLLSLSISASRSRILHSSGASSIPSSGEQSLETQCSYPAWESFSLTESDLNSQNLSMLLNISSATNLAPRDVNLRSRRSLNSSYLWSNCENVVPPDGSVSVPCFTTSSGIVHSTGTLSIVSSGELSVETQCSYSAWESFSLTESSETSNQMLSMLLTISNSPNVVSKDVHVGNRYFYDSSDSWSNNESIAQIHNISKPPNLVPRDVHLRNTCPPDSSDSWSNNESIAQIHNISNSPNSVPQDVRLRTRCSFNSTDSSPSNENVVQNFSTTAGTRHSLLTLASRTTVCRTQFSYTASFSSSKIPPMSSGSLALPPNGGQVIMQEMVEGAFNKFVELGRYLGGGTYGKVYKARDRSDFRKEFVVKIMARNWSGKNEIEIMEKINGHPNVVEILGHGSNSQFYHVFMSLDGTWSFDKFCRKFQTHLGEEAMRYFFNQMATAVDHLHSLDVAHLDIKPSNMVINDKLQVKLIDFGLSKDLQHEGMGPFFGHCGTRNFMAAEMLQGRYAECYPKPADIWSLGVTLYYCIFGYFPFDISANDFINRRTSRYFTTPMDYMSELKDLLAGMFNVYLQHRYDIYHVRKHIWCQRSTNFDINNFHMQPTKKTKTIKQQPSNHSSNYVCVNVSSNTQQRSSYQTGISAKYSSCSLLANVSGTTNRAISSSQQSIGLLNKNTNDDQDMVILRDKSVSNTSILPLRKWILEIQQKPFSAPGKLYSPTTMNTKLVQKTSTSSNMWKCHLGLAEQNNDHSNMSTNNAIPQPASDSIQSMNNVLPQPDNGSIQSMNNVLPQPDNGSIQSMNNVLPQPDNGSIQSMNNVLPQPDNGSIQSMNNVLPQPDNGSIQSMNNVLPQPDNGSIQSTNNALPQPVNDSIQSTNNALPQPVNDSIQSMNNVLPQPDNNLIQSTNNALPQPDNNSIQSMNNVLPQPDNNSIQSTNNALPQLANDLIVSTNNALPQPVNDAIQSMNNALSQPANGSIQSTNNALPQPVNDSIQSMNNVLPQPDNGSIQSMNNVLPQPDNGSIQSTNNALPQPVNDSIQSTNNALPQPVNDSIQSMNNVLPQPDNNSIQSMNNVLPQPDNNLIQSTNNALPQPVNDSIQSTNNALPQLANDLIVSTNNALPQPVNDAIQSMNNALSQPANGSIQSTNNALPQPVNDSFQSMNNALSQPANASIQSTNNALPQLTTESHVSQSILKVTRLIFQGALALYHGSWPQSY